MRAVVWIKKSWGQIMWVLGIAISLGVGASIVPAMTAAADARAETAGAALAGSQTIVFGMGCFWGAEKRMSELPGVLDVESGYANGEVEGRYQTVLAHERALRQGRTTLRNHAEVVRVRFDPAQVSLEAVLAHFWESHDPTQGDRQGNDIGSNYRSAIYTQSDDQQQAALQSRDRYQQALDAAGLGQITTDIAPLNTYYTAEAYHQDYLEKNPDGYCGLGGTGVHYPAAAPGVSTPRQADAAHAAQPLEGASLDSERQLVVYEAEDCPFCARLQADVLDGWQSPVPVVATRSAQAPTGWQLQAPLRGTPTVVLFAQGREVARYTGYDGEAQHFWAWLGEQLLTPEQRRIAFEQGTERPFTGQHLGEHRAGTYLDPITGVALFRSDAKFDSSCGWPSFFDPMPGALTMRPDHSHGMRRIEVLSASSGIHLGHVFDDGPPPTGKRYCINGNVLRFVPDPA